MDRFLHLILPKNVRKVSTVFLACAWVSGLVLGAVLPANDFLVSAMRRAAAGPVSITGLLAAILLPFLFSAFAVYSSEFWLLIPIAFIKAFLFSFSGAAVIYSFGQSGWLVRLLLIFSDSLMLPFLWWYWLQALSFGKTRFLFNSICVLIAAFIIGSLDFTVISPFLVKVLSI